MTDTKPRTAAEVAADVGRAQNFNVESHTISVLQSWADELLEHERGRVVGPVLDLIYNYGSIDGSHHKQWVIDQVLRLLLQDGYQNWVASFECAPGCEPDEWDTGIAP